MKELFVALGSTRYHLERYFYRHAGPGLVSDVAVGPDGLIHVLIRHDPLSDDSGPAVVTLDAGGRILLRWGDDDISDGHMLRVSPDGRVFIVDRDAHCVAVFRETRLEATIGTRNGPEQPFNHPTAVAFALDGSVLVSDGYAHAFIHRYGEALEPLTKWGAHGRGDGQFRNPHCVWVLPDSRVAVVDRGNDRVQVFSPDGQFLASLDGFVQPMGIWGDAAGRMFVTDSVPSLTLIDGDLCIVGRCRPVTNGAHGVSGAADGAIYLAEPGEGRVSRLIPQSFS